MGHPWIGGSVTSPTPAPEPPSEELTLLRKIMAMLEALMRRMGLR